MKITTQKRFYLHLFILPSENPLDTRRIKSLQIKSQEPIYMGTLEAKYPAWVEVLKAPLTKSFRASTSYK